MTVTRLLCMYNDLDPRVANALERYAPENGLTVEWIDTSESLTDYARELNLRWNKGYDIILVEQDKELEADMLPSLMSCNELWCGYAIWFNPVPHTMLAMGAFGIVKFSQEVQRLVPVSAFEGEHQFQIDRRFYDYLIANYDTGCHIHGMAVHHHVYEPRPIALRKHVQELREAGILPPQCYPDPAGPHLLPGSYDIPTCPGCNCRYGTEDADRNECACDGICCGPREGQTYDSWHDEWYKLLSGKVSGR